MLLVLNTTVSPSWEVLGHHLHFYPTGSRALSMCSLRVHWTRRSRMWSCWMCQQPVRPAFLWTEDVLHHFEFNIHSQLSYLKVPVNMFIIIPIFFFKQMALGCQKNSRSHGRTTGMGWRTRISPVGEKLNHHMAHKQRWPRGSQLTCHVEGMKETTHCFPETGNNVHKERNISHFVPSVIKSHCMSGYQSVTLSTWCFSLCSVSFFSSAWSLPGKTLLFHWGRGGERDLLGTI